MYFQSRIQIIPLGGQEGNLGDTRGSVWNPLWLVLATVQAFKHQASGIKDQASKQFIDAQLLHNSFVNAPLNPIGPHHARTPLNPIGPPWTPSFGSPNTSARQPVSRRRSPWPRQGAQHHTPTIALI